MSQADAREANQALLHKSDHQPPNYYYSIPRRQRQGGLLLHMTCHTKANQKSQNCPELTLVVCSSHSPAQPILRQLILVWRVKSRESTWESSQQQGDTEARCSSSASGSLGCGCDVKSRWMCRQGGGGAAQQMGTSQTKIPLMQIAPDDNLKKKKKMKKEKKNYTERGRENWRKHLMCEQYSL